MRFLLWLVPLATLAQTPNAADLLARSGGALLNANSLRLAGTRVQETLTPPGQTPTRSSFSIAVAPGGRFRRATTNGEELQLEVSDGTYAWGYSTPGNTWSRRPASSPPAIQELQMLRYGRDRANLLTASVEREDSLDFGGRLTLCYVVRAAYRGVPWAPSANEVLRTVWIARDSDLVLRDTWEVAVAGPFSNTLTRGRQVVDFSTIELNGPMAPDLFAFAPPEGSRQVAPPPGATGAGTGSSTSAGQGGVAGGVTSNPVLTHRVEADYTPEARAAGYQGTVALYLEVTPEGKAVNIQVMQGLGLGLDQKAIEAASQWQFKPGILNGQPAGMAVSADVSFSLAPAGAWSVRRAVYTVDRDRSKSEVLQKPALKQFTSPDAGSCSAPGGSVDVNLQISESGAPKNVRVTASPNDGLGKAVLQAIEAWRYNAGTADRRPRAAQGRLELECGVAAPAGELSPSRAGNGVSMPSIADRMEPEYSEEARRQKLQGSVQLQLVVDATGHATNIVIPRMLGLGLDEKAMEAVKTWRFKPGMKDGNPVSVFATIEVNFRLL
jgi:TonB family protein